jgi:hypothetical protein
MGTIKAVSLKAHTQSLLRSVQEVILEGVSGAVGHKSAADLKRSLVKALRDSERFHQAVDQVHAVATQASQRAPGVRPGRRPVGETLGRVQASRHDPSSGQRDRIRGDRAKGGQRQGKRWDHASGGSKAKA